jgi:hypothetical protein
MHTEFWLENLKERDYWHIQMWMGNNIETDIKIIGSECVDWINLSQDKENVWPDMNVVMNLLVP